MNQGRRSIGLGEGLHLSKEREKRSKEREVRRNESSALQQQVFVSICSEVPFVLYLNEISSIGRHN